MISQLENAGLSFVGRDETGRRMEVSICIRIRHTVFFRNYLYGVTRFFSSST